MRGRSRVEVWRELGDARSQDRREFRVGQRPRSPNNPWDRLNVAFDGRQAPPVLGAHVLLGALFPVFNNFNEELDRL